MRADLETAMGVVLTSRTARNLILEAPGDLAAHFGLTPAEVASLTAMAGDLAELMPGFVTKRERGLRQAMNVTMAALDEYAGDEAAALAGDYTEGYAPVDTAAADALRFAGYLVGAIRERADKFPYGAVILDVARLERLRLLAFHTDWPLRLEPESAPLDARRIDPQRRLWLGRGAAIERFGYDVRTVRAERSGGTISLLRPDPANLLCFQRPDDGEVMVVRIDDESACAVKFIASRPGELTAARLGRLVGAARPAEALIGKLVVLGVVKGES